METRFMAFDFTQAEQARLYGAAHYQVSGCFTLRSTDPLLWNALVTVTSSRKLHETNEQ